MSAGCLQYMNIVILQRAVVRRCQTKGCFDQNDHDFYRPLQQRCMTLEPYKAYLCCGEYIYNKEWGDVWLKMTSLHHSSSGEPLQHNLHKYIKVRNISHHQLTIAQLTQFSELTTINISTIPDQSYFNLPSKHETQFSKDASALKLKKHDCISLRTETCSSSLWSCPRVQPKWHF